MANSISPPHSHVSPSLSKIFYFDLTQFNRDLNTGHLITGNIQLTDNVLFAICRATLIK